MGWKWCFFSHFLRNSSNNPIKLIIHTIHTDRKSARKCKQTEPAHIQLLKIKLFFYLEIKFIFFAQDIFLLIVQLYCNCKRDQTEINLKIKIFSISYLRENTLTHTLWVFTTDRENKLIFEFDMKKNNPVLVHLEKIICRKTHMSIWQISLKNWNHFQFQ